MTLYWKKKDDYGDNNTSFFLPHSYILKLHVYLSISNYLYAIFSGALVRDMPFMLNSNKYFLCGTAN